MTAEKYQLEALKQEAFDALSSLDLPDGQDRDYVDIFAAMRIVFTGTCQDEQPLRLLLMRRCVWRARELLETESFKELLREVPDIAIALLDRQLTVFTAEAIPEMIRMEVHDCNGKNYFSLYASCTATPNDHIRAVRKSANLSQAKQDSFELSLVFNTYYPDEDHRYYGESDELVSVEKHEFDTTIAEVNGITVRM